MLKRKLGNCDILLNLRVILMLFFIIAIGFECSQSITKIGCFSEYKPPMNKLVQLDNYRGSIEWDKKGFKKYAEK